MRDRSLDILLMVFFGIGGTIILVLTWSQPMLIPERILCTSIGSMGLVWTTARVRPLMPVPGRMVVKSSKSRDRIEEHIVPEVIK